MNLLIGTIFSGDHEIWERLAPKRTEQRWLGLNNEPQTPRGARHVLCLTPNPSYAALRNEMMAMLRPQAAWLLFLDADEFMTQESLARITQTLPHLREHCYYFSRINYVLDEKTYLGGDHYPDYQARLVRLSSKAHYSGSVHECVHGVERLPFPGPAVIYHYGLLRDPQHVFNLRKKYAQLQGAYHLDIMPADYGLYPTIGPKLPIPIDLLNL